MARMKNCQLCLKEYIGEGVAVSVPKLPEMCFRYLHSALTSQILICQDSVKNFATCPECFASGIKLVALSEQMEFLQKSVADLVLMFSLEILHRRGENSNTKDQSGDNNINNGKKLVAFDVSPLPTPESWKSFKPNNITDIFATCESELQGIDTESIHDDKVVDYVDPLSIDINTTTINDYALDNTIDIEYIKCEPNPTWADGRQEIENSNEITETEVLTEKDHHAEIFISPSTSTDNNIHRKIPAVKLRRLKFRNDKEVVAFEGNINDPNQTIHPKKKLRTSFWSKSNLGNSYKIQDMKNLESHVNCEEVNVPQKLPSSPEALNETLISSDTLIIKTDNGTFEEVEEPLDHFDPLNYLLSKPRRTNSRPSKKRSARVKKHCDICNKTFSHKGAFIVHERLHTGARPFECTICPRSYTSPSALQFHHRSRHTTEKPFICTLCTKGFAQRSDLSRHVRTVHSETTAIQS